MSNITKEGKLVTLKRNAFTSHLHPSIGTATRCARKTARPIENGASTCMHAQDYLCNIDDVISIKTGATAASAGTQSVDARFLTER